MVDFTKYTEITPQHLPEPSVRAPRGSSKDSYFNALGSDEIVQQRVNPVAGFTASAATGVGEVFGLKSSDYVTRYRRQSPAGALTSQLGGTLIPYIGWEYAAAKTIGLGAKGVAIGSSVQKPLRLLAQEKAAAHSSNLVLQGALREGMVFAPFEAARGVSRLIAGDDAGDVAKGAVFDLGLAGGFGAAQGIFRGIGQGRQVVEELGDEAFNHEWDVLKAMKTFRANTDMTADQVLKWDRNIESRIAATQLTRPLGKDGNKLIVGDNDSIEFSHFAQLQDGDIKLRTTLEDMLTIGPSSGQAGIVSRQTDDGVTSFAGVNRKGTETVLPGAGINTNVLFPPAPKPVGRPPKTSRVLFPGPVSELRLSEGTVAIANTLDFTVPDLNTRFNTDAVSNLKEFAKRFNAKPAGLPATNARVWYASPGADHAFNSAGESSDAFKVLTGRSQRDYAEHIQYPTEITVRPRANAADGAREAKYKELKNWHAQEFEEVAPGKYLKREQNDGMYLLHIADDANMRMLSFKTDQPSLFVKEAEHLDATMRKRGFEIYPPKPREAIGQEYWDEAVNLHSVLHPQMIEGVTKAGYLQDYVKNFFGINPDGLFARAGKAVRSSFAPADFKYVNPRARLMLIAARNLDDKVTARVNKIVLGGKIAEGTSPLKASLRGAKFEGNGWQQRFTGIAQDKNQEAILVRAINDGLSPDEAISFGAGEDTVELLKSVLATDKQLREELNVILRATDKPEVEILDNHYGFAHEWKDWVVPVYDGDSLAKVHTVSADTKGEAEELAREFIKAAAANERNFIYRTEEISPIRQNVGRGKGQTPTDQSVPSAALRDSDNELKKYLQSISNRPSSGQEWREMMSYLNVAKNSLRSRRKGVGGFRTEDTAAGMLKRITQRMTEMEKFKAKLSLDNIFESHIYQLGLENLDEAQGLAKDLRITAGLDSAIFEWEKKLDTIGAPAFGKNAALKTARALNTIMYTGTLGVATMAYPAMNLLTFTQTSSPHLAWLMKGDPKTLQKWYTTLPIEDWANRKTYGGMHSLDPVKIAGQAASLLRNPTKAHLEHIQRNLIEGHIDNRMLEGYLGRDSVMGDMARNAFGKGNVDKIIDIATYAADNSERLSRLHSLAMGLKFGEDVLKLDGDKLYRFARDFQRNTMFGYNTVDRAAMFRGATGSMLGLFKNWITHQMGWTAQYAGDIGAGGGQALLTMNAMAALVGGLGATHIGALATGMNSALGDERFLSDLYKAQTSNSVTDAFMFGLPSFLGFTLQGNAALPGSQLGRDVTQMFNFAQLEQAGQMFKAAGGGIRHWQLTGHAPWEDRKWMDSFIRATGVKTAYRLRQVTGQQGIRSLYTGQPVVQKAGMGDKLMYTLGLNPVDVQKEYKLAEMARNAQGTRSELITTYARQWAEAKAQGDHDGMYEIRREAMLRGVSFDSLERSYKRREKLHGQGAARRAAKSPEIRERFGISD